MNHPNSTQTSNPSSNPRTPKNFLPNVPMDEAILPSTKSATQETIERMEYETAGYPLDINSEGEALASDGQAKSTEDLNFKTELELDGYESIEEYDNDSYLQDVDGRPASDRELRFFGREQLDSGEESPVDPQENAKNPNR